MRVGKELMAGRNEPIRIHSTDMRREPEKQPSLLIIKLWRDSDVTSYSLPVLPPLVSCLTVICWVGTQSTEGQNKRTDKLRGLSFV